MDFTSTLGVAMIKVSAGVFTMGSPETESGRKYWEVQREMTLPRDFWLGMSPVTQAQFEAVMGANPTDFPQSHRECPVDSVNWDQATEFCRRLTEIDRQAGVLPEDGAYRLPTEAEWEYACRAGNPASRYGKLNSIAWYLENASLSPHPVGRKQPNDWGFHDMLGNVWELCQGWFHVGHGKRAVRGGSYFNTANCCRAAAREGYSGGRYVGFRLLAGPAGPFELSPAVDELATPREDKPTIYGAIHANDPQLASHIVKEDPEALESYDEIPPPMHWAIYNDKPEMISWLLDRGADIERLEQDHGATPLTCAVVMRNKPIIALLIERGADAGRAMQVARNGLAGHFENFGLDREGYRAIIELLRQLGV